MKQYKFKVFCEECKKYLVKHCSAIGALEAIKEHSKECKGGFIIE